ncbi:allergen Fel d 4-like [Ochotona princeps]|uniref:allergen Fel d 4-like n=1 Tax=Ochotona princeps TaxID=9978 RepID=UPI0027154CA2|nr:allergen Fel d 4-like [Ochotona princeps]
MPTLPLLFLSLGLGLARAQQDESQVPAQPGFHPEQVEGFWYTRQLGSTDRSVIEEGGSYRCYMSSIRVLDNGNVNITYFHRQNGRCVEDFYMGEPTGSPGRYTFQYEGLNYLTFVAVGEDFVVIDLENHNASGQLVVAELHSRTPLASELGQQAYNRHTHRRGIQPGDTVDLTADPGRCSASSP